MSCLECSVHYLCPRQICHIFIKIKTKNHDEKISIMATSSAYNASFTTLFCVDRAWRLVDSFDLWRGGSLLTIFDRNWTSMSVNEWRKHHGRAHSVSASSCHLRTLFWRHGRADWDSKCGVVSIYRPSSAERSEVGRFVTMRALFALLSCISTGRPNATGRG